MKRLFLLLFFCSSAWGDCDESPPDLTRMLSYPMGKKQIVAVVKGSIISAEDPESEFLVDYFDVEQSYGLDILKGRYQIKTERYWGRDCHFYAEDNKWSGSPDTNDSVYLALSRVHGRTLVTPEGSGNGHSLYLDSNSVIYKIDGVSVNKIERKLFEKYVLKGIPVSLWQTLTAEKPSSD